MRRDPLGPEEVDPALGIRLRGIRTEQQKTMKQVAHFIGTSFDTVSLMEKGRQPILVSRLILWCLYLKVDPGELLRLSLADIARKKAAHE